MKQFQGEPFGYLIIYHPAGLETRLAFFTVDFPSNIATMNDLGVYTMYVIKVSAVSSGGLGPANIVKARTDAAGKENLRKISFTKRKRYFPHQYINSRTSQRESGWYRSLDFLAL